MVLGRGRCSDSLLQSIEIHFELRFRSRSRFVATLVWLRSASEVWDRSTYHPIGLGDPDPRFFGPMVCNRVAAPFGFPINRPV
jgi:hypothetical protein